MALNKAQLVADLTAMMQDVSQSKTAADAAQQMADAIDAFVKSGTVNTVVVTPDTINGTGIGAVT